MRFLKNFYDSFFRREIPVRQDVSNKREKLKLLKLKESDALPDVDGPFELHWTIAHDEDFDDVLLFEFRRKQELLHRELAIFEDYARARELASHFCSKYGDQLREIRLGPGVGVYIDGSGNSRFNDFAKHVCNLGYERVDEDFQLVKHDGATREIFVSETIFKLHTQ